MSFDEVWEPFRDNLPATTDMLRNATFCQVAEHFWHAAHASAFREGLERSMEAVQGERLACHALMLAKGARNEIETGDDGYSHAIDAAESAIRSLLPGDEKEGR